MNAPPPCDGRDPDILLLAHRQLAPGAALALWIHLLFCPACYARYRQFVGVSSVLRAGTRPAGGASGASFPAAWVAAVVVALLLGGVLALNALRGADRFQEATPPRCAPGLASDRCR